MTEELEKQKSKKRTAASVKNRYNTKHYSRLVAELPKELVEQFKKKCIGDNIPYTTVLRQSIEEFLKK